MSLQARLGSLITAIGTDIKSLGTRVTALEGAGGGGPLTTALDMPEVATPAIPSVGRAYFYPMADGQFYARNDDGFALNVSDPLSSGRGWVLPRPGTANVDVLGSVTPTATGTLTLAARAITNKHTRMRRVDYLVTTAATTAVAGWRIPNPHHVRGNAAGVGGFYSKQIWGPATGAATTTNRAFVGLTNSTGAPTDVEPSTLVNCIGMGWDSADTNVQIYYNDATGVATKVNLGSSFPVVTIDRTQLYKFEVWCSPNGSKLNWRVTDAITGASTSGGTGVSTDIPVNTLYLAERGWMSVGGTSSVIGVAFVGLHFHNESP